MLRFQVFENYYRFPKIDENSRLKVLENKIENTILENKMNELIKEKNKLESELNKLIEQRDSKENYNNRINDIKNKLNTLNRLESFDRQVFEYMISKIMIGKNDDKDIASNNYPTWYDSNIIIKDKYKI